MKKVKLLDTTLRDGSYAINFQFSANETSIISRLLEEAGLEYIEVGHGVGLNASNVKGQGSAMASDEEYLKAASLSLKKSKFGMFCIPGIARLEDVDLCADNGAGFIRIGTNVTEQKKSTPFLARAREKGLLAAANFMKSYAMAPRELAKVAKRAESDGAEIIYLVDSAGGMLPENIESYISSIREISNIPIGFHGHNNIQLAVANSLKAIDLGAEIVDSSLQGLGRGAGNAPTETLVSAFILKNISHNYDLLKLMDIGEKYIRNLIPKKGIDSIDLISGVAMFHSSFMGLVRHASIEFQVDPRLLILEVGKIEKVTPTENIVREVASKIAKLAKEPFDDFHRMDNYFGHEQ